MALDFQVDGGAQLRKVAAQIRATGDKGLGRELAKALAAALEPVKTAIEASAEKTMPSGYKATLTASLRHRRTQRTSARQASVRLTTFADGQKERRDLPRLNKGELRHPVFGRYRRLKNGQLRKRPWSKTRIESGFHDRAVKDAGPEAEKRVLAVLDDFADRLAKG